LENFITTALNSPEHIATLENVKEMQGCDERIANGLTSIRFSEDTYNQAEMVGLVKVTIDAAIAQLLGVQGIDPKQTKFELKIHAKKVTGDIKFRVLSGKSKKALRKSIEHSLTPALTSFFQEYPIADKKIFVKKIKNHIGLEFANLLADKRVSPKDIDNIKVILAK